MLNLLVAHDMSITNIKLPSSKEKNATHSKNLRNEPNYSPKYRVNKTGTYNFYNTSIKEISFPSSAIFLVQEYPTNVKFGDYSTNNNGLIGYWNKKNEVSDIFINDDGNYSLSFILQDDELTKCEGLTAFTGNSQRAYGDNEIKIRNEINKNICIIGSSSDVGVFRAAIDNFESFNSANLFVYGINDSYCNFIGRKQLYSKWHNCTPCYKCKRYKSLCKSSWL